MIPRMAYLDSVPEDEAEGETAALYEQDRQDMGYVANYTRAFSLRPEVMGAWVGLAGSIRSGMDLRRYELATLAAARRLRSSYCTLAHGRVLAEKVMPAEQVRDVVADHRSAGLDDVEVACMDLADKVAADATSVTQADVDRLRELGCSDRDILDVILTASVRCFFSKVLDATGSLADPAFRDLDPALRDALTVGRPIAEG